MVNTIIINGRIPSKKNSVIAMVRGGRIIHIPSNKYREWHKDASQQLMGQRIVGKFPIEKTKLTINFFFPDLRKTDLTNKAESIMDMLVDNQILLDDNCYVVNELNLVFGGVDKENPRAEIVIS